MWLRSLGSLTYLNISGNSIMNLNGIESLRCLQILTAGTNLIKSLAPVAGLTSLTALEVSVSG